jgi:glutamine synthetase
VAISSYALACDVVGRPLPVPFAGGRTGWHDVRLRPDLATLRPFSGAPGTAVCLADVVDAAGAPVAVAPRTILRRQGEQAARLGFAVRLATELEFYVFQGTTRAARGRRFRDLEPTTPARVAYGVGSHGVEEALIRPLRAELAAAGIAVAACQPEAGLGQWEVNLDPADPLEMADRHALYKAAVKELALRADLTVTFMAKPVADDLGSSCHLHCSLLADGRPVFPEAPGSADLSATGRRFLGGLLRHLDASALCFAPYANSYKRPLAGMAAGGVVAWGHDNRTVALRVAGTGDTLRIEHRYPGADVNPYLAAAALLAAGLEGVASGHDPGPPVAGDGDERGDLPRPPASLGDALAAFERSSFGAAAFGAEVAAHYAALARGEWQAYLRAVTDWELLRAFEAA